MTQVPPRKTFRQAILEANKETINLFRKVPATGEDLERRAASVKTVAELRKFASDTVEYGAAIGELLKNGVGVRVIDFLDAKQSGSPKDWLLAATELENLIDTLTGRMPDGVEPKNATKLPAHGLDDMFYKFLGKSIDEWHDDDGGDDVESPEGSSSAGEFDNVTGSEAIRLAALEMFCVGYEMGHSVTGLANSKQNFESQLFRQQQEKRWKGQRAVNLATLTKNIALVRDIWESHIGQCKSAANADHQTASTIQKMNSQKASKELWLPSSSGHIYRYRMAAWDANTYLKNEAKRRGREEPKKKTARRKVKR